MSVHNVHDELSKISANINKNLKTIKNDSLKGMIEFFIDVRRLMDKVPPLVPVGTTGNLRSSWFVVSAIGDVSREENNATKNKKAGRLSVNDKIAQDNFVETQKNRAIASSNTSKPLVIAGFSANYAAYVHEMIDANFQRPGAGAKFFESALNTKAREIEDTIARKIKNR
jgi:hypothetical protein